MKYEDFLPKHPLISVQIKSIYNVLVGKQEERLLAEGNTIQLPQKTLVTLHVQSKGYADDRKTVKKTEHVWSCCNFS